MIIKIDVDGVIRDILTPMCKLYNDEFGENVKPEDFVEYDVEKIFPKWNGEARVNLFEYVYHSHYVFDTGAKLIDGAVDAINKLYDEGNYIIICTYQKTWQNKIDALNFLGEHGVKYNDICFTKNKDLIKCNIIIDDNPEFLEKEDENVVKVCVNMPYNKHYDCKNLIRVNSLSDFTVLFETVNKFRYIWEK